MRRVRASEPRDQDRDEQRWKKTRDSASRADRMAIDVVLAGGAGFGSPAPGRRGRRWGRPV